VLELQAWTTNAQLGSLIGSDLRTNSCRKTKWRSFTEKHGTVMHSKHRSNPSYQKLWSQNDPPELPQTGGIGLGFYVPTFTSLNINFLLKELSPWARQLWDKGNSRRET
jgi:hypothetical protein